MTDGQTLRFTRHARNRMRRYAVTAEDVETVLLQPLLLMSTEKGRTNAWCSPTEALREGGYAWLRVTFIEEAGRTVVITVTPRRRGPEGS